MTKIALNLYFWNANYLLLQLSNIFFIFLIFARFDCQVLSFYNWHVVSRVDFTSLLFFTLNRILSFGILFVPLSCKIFITFMKHFDFWWFWNCLFLTDLNSAWPEGPSNNLSRQLLIPIEHIINLGKFAVIKISATQAAIFSVEQRSIFRQVPEFQKLLWWPRFCEHWHFLDNEVWPISGAANHRGDVWLHLLHMAASPVS